MYDNTLLNEILGILSKEQIESQKLYLIQMQLSTLLTEYNFTKNTYKITTYSQELPSKEVKEYLVSLKVSGLATSTIKNYELELRLFQNQVAVPLCTVSSSMIMKYIYECQQYHKISDVTLEHKRLVLNGFYKWLCLEHKISENPCSRIKPIKCKSKVLEPLTNIELESMRLACLSARDKCLIEVLFSTGMRVSELRTVNVSSINFANKRLIILGKGNKERVIRFSDRAILLINQYIASRCDSNDALFVTTRKPYNRLTKSGIEYIIRHISVLANIDRIRVTPHTFRRNHGLAIYSKTNDIYKAAASLGHSNISTTTKYIKLSDASLQQTFDYVMN